MIKKAILTVGLFAIAVLFLFSNISGQSKPSVPYPEGYRKWAHVKSMLILP